MDPLNQAKTASGQTEAQLIELLSSATPTVLPDSQKRSSLETILSSKPERVAWGLRLGRPALVFGILLCVAGASAGATLGAHWISRRAPAARAPTPPVATAPPPVHAHRRPVAAPPADAPAAEVPTVELPKPMPSVPPRSHAPRGENPAALMAAVKALRQDHAPARASHLLREYLRRYPRGSLSEEARALAVEAARAQSSPNVGALADEYLRLYPHGRFRSAVEQATGRADP